MSATNTSASVPLPSTIASPSIAAASISPNASTMSSPSSSSSTSTIPASIVSTMTTIAATAPPSSVPSSTTAIQPAAVQSTLIQSSTATKPTKRPELGFKHMLAGSLAGMASKTILQPLDLVKVRLQVQDGTGKNEYKGLYHGVRTIIAKDGFFGLYRGLAPNLMASGVSWGVYFFSYNHAKNFWRQHLLHPSPSAALSSSSSSSTSSSSASTLPRLGPLAHLSCAAFSGTLATFFTNPFSMVKTRLQLQGKEVNTGARLYSGVFDAFFRIVREEGFLTLYRGIGPSLVLVSNGALQFMSYEELKRLTITHLIPSHDERELHAAHFLCMGALAKVFSATVTYPMAVTRARLYQRKPDALLKNADGTPQTPSSSSLSHKQADRKYDGMRDAITKTWKLEGWRGFYRGLVPTVLKTAPSSAITFLIYETTIKLLHAEPVPKKSKFD